MSARSTAPCATAGHLHTALFRAVAGLAGDRLLLRYEDLVADTAGTFAAALAFAGQPADRDAIRRAVEAARFSKLREQEQNTGFRETPRAYSGGVFFRRGQCGAWKDELTPDQAARLERDHAAMMRRLGYALSGKTDFTTADKGASARSSASKAIGWPPRSATKSS